MPAVAPSAAKKAERRIATRFQPAFGTVYRTSVNGERRAIWLVWNLSETGLSVLVADPPKAGAEVVGELTSEGGGPGLAVNLKVVHVRPTDTGDFCLGAQFARVLGADEIKPFITPPSRLAGEDDELPA